MTPPPGGVPSVEDGDPRPRGEVPHVRANPVEMRIPGPIDPSDQEMTR